MTDSPEGYLLQGGTIIGSGPPGSAALKNHDVLILGTTITEIGVNITVPRGRSILIIDCKDKIVAPGFVSTHNHLWQTQLKGRHGDDTQIQFNCKGNQQAVNYTPHDVYLGVLAACLECIDAGITTVVDNANIAINPAHSPAALAAIRDSHIRAVFCYTPEVSRATRNAPSIDSRFPYWSIEQFERMVQLPLPSRITMGLSVDSITSLGAPALRKFFRYHRLFRPKTMLIVHWADHEAFPSDDEHQQFLKRLASIEKEPEVASSFPHTLIAHACGPRPALAWGQIVDGQRSKINHVAVPFAEASLGLGTPLVHSALDLENDRTSLGVGCHSINAADLFVQMRTTLALNRIAHSQSSHDYVPGEPERKRVTTRNVFDLATRKGGEVTGKPDVGHLAVGCKADVVVYSTDSIQMSLAAEEDPCTAVVNYASPADVWTVFVDGVLRKSDGKLREFAMTSLDTGCADEKAWWSQLTNGQNSAEGARLETCKWTQLRSALQGSRLRINGRIDKTPVATRPA